jgi:hypothetical protein
MIKHTLYTDAQGKVTSTFVEYVDRDKGVIYAKGFDSELESNFQCDAMAEQYGVNIARIVTAE